MQQQQQPQQQPGTPTGQNQPPEAPSPGQLNPPPPGPYPSQHQMMMQQQQGYYQQPIIIAPIFGMSACSMYCIYCGAGILTTVRTSMTACAWITFVILLITGLFFFIPLFFLWVPCCMDSFKVAEHTCPNCNRVLGRSEDEYRI